MGKRLLLKWTMSRTGPPSYHTKTCFGASQPWVSAGPNIEKNVFAHIRRSLSRDRLMSRSLILILTSNSNPITVEQ